MTEGRSRAPGGHLRVIWGPVWEVGSRVNSGSILSQFWVNSRTLSQKSHHSTENCLHLAVGRALSLEYVKYGVREGPRVGTGIAPPSHPLVPIPRVHPSPYPAVQCREHGAVQRLNSAVGLKSVAQLSLYSRFSGFLGITEVYNLAYAGNPNDHFFISGND